MVVHVVMSQQYLPVGDGQHRTRGEWLSDSSRPHSPWASVEGGPSRESRDGERHGDPVGHVGPGKWLVGVDEWSPNRSSN